MRITVAVLSLMMFCSGAFANDPASDFIATHPQISCVCLSYGRPGFRLDGAPGSTSKQIAQAYTDAAAFDWTIKSDSNPPAAKQAIQNDLNIPVAAQIQLYPYLAIINDYPNNAAGSKSVWASMKQVFGSSWLTPSVVTAVEQHCIDANMPLK